VLCYAQSWFARAACKALALEEHGNLHTLRRRLMLHLCVFKGGEDSDTRFGHVAMREPALSP